ASATLRPGPPPVSGIAQTSWRGTSRSSAWQHRSSFWNSNGSKRMSMHHLSRGAGAPQLVAMDGAVFVDPESFERVIVGDVPARTRSILSSRTYTAQALRRGVAWGRAVRGES